MSTKPESVFRKKVVKWLSEKLTNVDVTSIQQIALTGTPDLYLCLNGFFIAMELKVGDNKITELQKHKLQRISSKGKGIALVVNENNWEWVQTILLKLDQGEAACRTNTMNFLK